VRLGRKPKLTSQQKHEALVRRAAGETLMDIVRSYNDSFAAISRLKPERHMRLPRLDLDRNVARFYTMQPVCSASGRCCGNGAGSAVPAGSCLVASPEREAALAMAPHLKAKLSKGLWAK
jgi:hypothetical protein